jgi:hypothetical protein
MGSGLPKPEDVRAEAAMVRALLARSTPPEVVLPKKVGMSLSLPPHLYRDDEVHAALDAAGVPWKEVGRE